MKSKKITSKLVLAIVLSLGVMFAGNGIASANVDQSERKLQLEKVQQRALSALHVRRHHALNNNANYSKRDVCYLREAIQESDKEIQRRKTQERALKALRVRNNDSQETYQLTKVGCEQHYTQKPKVHKSEKEIQREKVQQRVLGLLHVRS